MGSEIDCPARADYYGRPSCFAYAFFEGRAANRNCKKADREPQLCCEATCKYKKHRGEYEQRRTIQRENQSSGG